MSEFSDNLKSLLNELEMTPQELAKETGLTPRAVYYYLNDEREPTSKALNKIHHVIRDNGIDISINELKYGKELNGDEANDCRLDELIHNFKLYCPWAYEDAIDFHLAGFFELIIDLKDGSKMRYVDIDHVFCYFDDECEDEDVFRKRFRNRLRTLMIAAGVSQKKLSALSGITEQTISKYMMTKATPSLYNADRIARALGCEVSDLYY